VQILDAEFAPEMRVNKSTTGFYFHIGKKLADVLVLSDQTKLRVPIRRGVPDEKLTLVAKSLGEDEERFGSVSLLLEQYFSSQSLEVTVG
jgi:hypothetical protein